MNSSCSLGVIARKFCSNACSVKLYSGGAAGSFAFKRLEVWLSSHFENEKLYAQALDLDFDRHEAAHRRLLEELDALQDQLMSQRLKNVGNKSQSYYRILYDWLVGHILNEDMRMKSALLNHPYNYIPSGQIQEETLINHKA